MNVVALFLLGLVVLIFQTSVFRMLGASDIKAPLILAVVLHAAFRVEEVRALILCFALGYAVDVYSGGVQGTTSLVMVLLCLVGQWMSRGILVDGKLAFGVLSLAFGLMYGLLWVGIESLVEGRNLLEESPAPRILWQALVLAMVSPLLAVLAERVDRLASVGWRRLQGRKA
jgi:rod shape-determining protein MreD